MDHPCGNLPLRECHVFVWACVHCGAVWADVTNSEQASEEAITTARSTIKFGPFDSADDVSAVVSDLARRHVRETIQGSCGVGRAV